MPKMIRLSDAASLQLDKLSQETHETKQQLLDRAVDLLARRFFLEKTNKQYAAIKQDAKAWQAELEEREEWDVALMDGLGGDGFNGK